MGRNLLSSMAVAAAAALLAACGGQSGGGSGTTSDASATRATTTATTAATTTSASRPSTEASGGGTVSAVHGGFAAVIPRGYRNGLVAAPSIAPSGAEYMVIGPREGNLGTSLSVFRAAAGGRDVAAVAGSALHNLAHESAFLPKPRNVSPLQSLSIAGEPALALDYQLAGHRASYRRQIFVIHGGWAYEISDIAASLRYEASLRALDEVIRSWRWR